MKDITWKQSHQHIYNGNNEGKSSRKAIACCIQVWNPNEPIEAQKVDDGDDNLNYYDQGLNVDEETEFGFVLTYACIT